MQNLTKEGFFNELYALYPDAVEKFCKWIDAYKEEVKWKELFAPGVKFHDIPFEMQLGIMKRYCIELNHQQTCGCGKNTEHFERITKIDIRVFTDLIRQDQGVINKKKAALN